MIIAGVGGICVAANTFDKSIPSISLKEINKSDVQKNNSNGSKFDKSENITRLSPWDVSIFK